MGLLPYLIPLLIPLALAWHEWRRLYAELGNARRHLANESGLRASAEQRQAATHARLCRLVAAQDKILENERRRIARDMHDDLGQNLLALKIDLGLLRSHGAELAPKINEQLALISGNLDLTIRSLRGIINDLHPVALQGGLRQAAESQLREFSRINNIAHQFDADPGLGEAGCGELDTTVFRILQESLANIARHAKASMVRVALARQGHALRLMVGDNGVGLPPGARLRGCGLQGIEDRARAAGGTLAVDSGPGGTTLTLLLPLPDKGAARGPRPAAALGMAAS
jgi:signal transduction histidine kinase